MTAVEICPICDIAGCRHVRESKAKMTHPTDEAKKALEGVPALLAEIAAKDAEIARLRGEIIEATDENFIWGAMDNVHDADTTLDDYAAAVSRAQRAALARVKGGAT